MKNIVIIILTVISVSLFNSSNIWAQNKIKQKIRELKQSKTTKQIVIQNDNNEYKTNPKKTVDYAEVFPQRFGIDGASPKWLKTIAEINDGWSGVNGLIWGQIEPIPPKNGGHFYKWQKIDEFLNNAQSTKRKFQINIRISNEWALEYSHDPKAIDDHTGKKKGTIIQIKPEQLSNWEAFITSFVERYDADSYDDMPNLKYPVTYIQIECEPDNIWEDAQGYIQALSTAYVAAKKANPNVQILAAGFNMGDLFGLTPEEQQFAFNKQLVQHKIKFLKDFFAKAEPYFDILSVHLNRGNEDIPPTVEWFQTQMRINGYQKPVWSEDTTSGPYLSGTLSTAEDKKRLQLLERGNLETIKWYQQEQAELLVKKSVTAFSSGVEKVFISSDVDWSTYHMTIWRHMGLLDAEGNKKPAFYAFKTMVAKLDSFTKINKLNLPEGILGYCFTKPVGNIYVLWCEEEKTIDLSGLSLETTSVIITDIAGDAYETTLLSQIHVNPQPIFIEKTK